MVDSLICWTENVSLTLSNNIAFSSKFFCVKRDCLCVSPLQILNMWGKWLNFEFRHKITGFYFFPFLFCFVFVFIWQNFPIFLLYDINANITKISRKTPKYFFQFSISQRLGFSGYGGIVHFSNFIWRQKLYRSRHCLQKSCDYKNFGAT